MATGQKGGMYYNIGKFLTRSLRKDPNSLEAEPYSLEVVSTPGSIANLRGVKDGRYDLGIVQSDVLRFYRDPNFNEANTKGCVIGAIYREPVYILVRNTLCLSGIDELRGKKVAIGMEGSGTKYTSEVILGMFGISLDEIKRTYCNYEKTATKLKNGTIDAAFIVIAKMPKWIEDLIGKHVYILKMDRSDLTRIASAHPYLYQLIDVPHPVDERQFPTISVTSVLIADPNKVNNKIADRFADLLWNICKGRNKSGSTTPEYNDLHKNEPDIVGLLVDYPFVLDGERNNPELFHEAASKYYETPELVSAYRRYRAKPYIIPVVFLVPLLIFLVPLLLQKPKIIGLHKWAICLRNRVPACGFICLFLVILILLYIGIYSYESGAENPDISGSPRDWLNMLLFVSQLDEIFCVTRGGKMLRRFASIIGPAFGILMVMRISGPWLLGKIREALKMIPDNSHGHVVICNWTAKTKTIINELRSPIIKRRKRIIILARPTQEPPDQSMLRKDVWILAGEPADEDFLRSKKANIRDADIVLILAEDKESGEPDARSLLILHAVKNVLRSKKSAVPDGAKTVGAEEEKMQRGHQRPNIIVEITKSDFEGPMRDQGADEMVPSAEITAKLLARAVGMRKVRVIEFIRKILTSDKVSNEVYELEIGDRVRPKILEDCKEKRGEGKCTFSDFAYEIAERYRKKYKDSITVVGVQSGGINYINPKDKDFSMIKGTINAAIVLAWKPPKKLRRQ